MAHRVYRPASALASLLLCLAFLVSTAGTGYAAPRAENTPPPPEPCSNKRTPPPDVDAAEGSSNDSAPPPLTVPDDPIGGERMGECREVLPPDAGDPPGDISAASWIISDLDSGEVLAAKDPHGRHHPASLIKVLLAVAVIDELDPDDVVTATDEDADQVCTCAGLVAGNDYSVNDLLTSALIHSGNDSAHALGNALGGVPSVLETMNELATDLHAYDTRAATTSGLDAPGMSSSAYDMSLIFRYAMHQPQFVEAIRTRNMEFSTEEDEEPITLYNDNQLIDEYDGFLGGKTGFTSSARHTYMGAAEHDGTNLGVVLMRAEQEPESVTEQSAALLDYGFTLADSDHDPVGDLVLPGDLEDGDELATDLGPQGSTPEQTTADGDTPAAGGAGGFVALLVAGLALVGIIALRKGASGQ